MWSLKHIILRGTGRGSRLYFPNCTVTLNDRTGATNKQCYRCVDATSQIGTSKVLICGFDECHATLETKVKQI